MNPFTICGTIIHAPACGEIEIIENGLIVVDEAGGIAGVHSPEVESYESVKQTAVAANSLIELAEGQYLLPGLIDLHVHAPQWPQAGNALHLPLYTWLQEYTFPLEAKYTDLAFAEKVYASLVDTLIANGTTTTVYFATVHLEATKLLADICLAKGQRALVGKVAMDNPNECPDYYRDSSAQQGLADTRALIEYVRTMPGNEQETVLPVITPRFIPSCTDEMLTGLGELAAEYHCHVQTHCSESDWAHNYVLNRHGKRDTDSLNDFKLLTNKTILAHSCFINKNDMATIKQQRSGIAHCPLSNAYFADAVFPARRALDLGLDVGLGTDVAGGATPSLLQNCHAAVTASRYLEGGVDKSLPQLERGVSAGRIDFKEAFWMATTGGGKALDLNIGLLKKGYAFDALVLDTRVANSNLVVWNELDKGEDVLQKIIYNASRQNIRKVWVQGKLIGGVDQQA
ncbi:guanine deaminase [Candidatus Leptofilum sp.]|uniref:guanine deaminase n=1 Tax=Candidatus Leptofilum sp. TaxID=3241576 RepID=UPI003B5AC92A